MLLVKTRLGISKIQGIGLFADEYIPKGASVWRYKHGFDLKISEKKLRELSEPARTQVLNYGYLNSKTKNYVLCSDDARFMNSSHDANLKDTNNEGGISIAKRDIAVNEEITCDYLEFDSSYKEKGLK